MTTSKRRPPLAFIILAPVLSVVLTLFAIELVLRLFRPVPYSIERNMYYEPDPYTGFRLRPYAVGYFQNAIPAIANSLGYRDDEVSPTKPDGVFRVLMLGDSFTVGANVRQEEAYAQVLERLLNERRPTQQIEVVNTAVGGWEPFQYAQYYEHYGRQLQPDLIVIGFFVGNDAYNQLEKVEQLPTAILGRRVSPGAADNEVTALRVFLLEHSHLARLLMQQTPHALVFTRQRCDEFTEDYLAIQSDRLKNHLQRSAEQEALAENSVRQVDRIREMAELDQVPVVVVLLPDENQLNPALQARLVPPDQQDRYDFDMPQSLLLERFQALGVPTIDLLPQFRADPRCLYMNDTHWTSEGHGLAAQAIMQGLSAYLP